MEHIRDSEARRHVALKLSLDDWNSGQSRYVPRQSWATIRPGVKLKTRMPISPKFSESFVVNSIFQLLEFECVSRSRYQVWGLRVTQPRHAHLRSDIYNGLLVLVNWLSIEAVVVEAMRRKYVVGACDTNNPHICVRVVSDETVHSEICVYKQGPK